MFLIAVHELENISVNTRNFLVLHYNQVRCDPIHSAVTTELQTTDKLRGHKTWSRSHEVSGGKPYQVFDLQKENIKDYKAKPHKTEKRRRFRRMCWQKMSWMSFQKSELYKMKFTEIFYETFKTLDFNKRCSRQTFLKLKQLFISSQWKNLVIWIWNWHYLCFYTIHHTAY